MTNQTKTQFKDIISEKAQNVAIKKNNNIIDKKNQISAIKFPH
jgi:hypothetical protein